MERTGNGEDTYGEDKEWTEQGMGGQGMYRKGNGEDKKWTGKGMERTRYGEDKEWRRQGMERTGNGRKTDAELWMTSPV